MRDAIRVLRSWQNYLIQGAGEIQKRTWTSYLNSSIKKSNVASAKRRLKKKKNSKFSNAIRNINSIKNVCLKFKQQNVLSAKILSTREEL
jgi:hypothetical protein